MPATITFFPVDNGDMTLIELESGKTILIDVNIRASADDPDDPTRDVAKDLRKRLKRDDKGRLYVDVFLLSHPDQDHCSGLDRHFHLGSPEGHGGDKVLIREIWSSPLIFRRASKNHPLCDDAKKFNTEAKRRVARYRASGTAVGDGDRILILGRDENGKTDDLTGILVEVDSLITRVNGTPEPGLSARLLGPLPKSEDEAEEETLSKNHSSVIMQFTITATGGTSRFLTGGDAEVAIWERLWDRHRHRDGRVGGRAAVGAAVVPVHGRRAFVWAAAADRCKDTRYGIAAGGAAVFRLPAHPGTTVGNAGRRQQWTKRAVREHGAR